MLIKGKLNEQVDELLMKWHNTVADNPKETIKFLLEAWELIPEDKYIYDQSFYVTLYMIKTALILNDKEIMREWVDRIFIANPDRTNFGEREYWKGVVEFELGNFDEAKKFLTLAYKKSGGREFSEEDKKYVDFIFGRETQEVSTEPQTELQESETELPDKIYNKITSLSEKGDSLAEKGKYDKAIETYNKALALIPLPKDNWEATTWLYAAIGDAYFFKKDWETAMNYFMDGQKCPDGLGNPFFCLRIGQCFYETGNSQKAESYLLQAYMLEGKDIFDMDECEPKYFEAIKHLI